MLLGPRAVLVRLRRTPLLRWPQTPRRARQSRAWLHLRYGAGDGNRTRDPELGRLALYHLSYSRVSNGEGRIRTSEGIRRQIYSLLPLATWVPLRIWPLGARADGRSRTDDLLITSQLLYP